MYFSAYFLASFCRVLDSGTVKDLRSHNTSTLLWKTNLHSTSWMSFTVGHPYPFSVWQARFTRNLFLILSFFLLMFWTSPMYQSSGLYITATHVSILIFEISKSWKNMINTHVNEIRITKVVLLFKIHPAFVIFPYYNRSVYVGYGITRSNRKI